MSPPTPPAAVAIIPARLGSTRFPGKVLADATGMPLIRHVHERASAARLVSRTVVATDDARIADIVRDFGGEVVLTRTDHPNGTSRIAEAAATLALHPGTIIANVQGDEPELDPAHIDACVGRLGSADVASLACAMPPGSDPDDPNIVKVVVGLDGRALYFSRAPIPHPRDPSGGARPLRHIGLYAYRRDFLDRYARWAPTPLERTESLEQLRALEHGLTIAIAIVPGAPPAGIDTPEQYAAFVARWRARTAP